MSKKAETGKSAASNIQKKPPVEFNISVSAFNINNTTHMTSNTSLN